MELVIALAVALATILVVARILQEISVKNAIVVSMIAFLIIVALIELLKPN